VEAAPEVSRPGRARGSRAACVALALAATAAAWAQPVLPPQALPGDLIFRKGTEAVSDAVMAVDDGEFSHVGMLVRGPAGWQVVHATPAEVPGRADGVVLDDLAFYTDPARAEHYAVYAVRASAAEREAAVKAALAARGEPFRLAQDGGTYCTALMWQAWRDAGVDLQVRFTPLAIPLLPGNYLLPSTLQHSPRVHALAAPALARAP